MVMRLQRKMLCRKETNPADPINLSDLVPGPCTLNITLGTFAPLFKPHAIPSVDVATLQIFRVSRGQKIDTDCRSLEKVNCFSQV
jgi:hypothetical protein